MVPKRLRRSGPAHNLRGLSSSSEAKTRHFRRANMTQPGDVSRVKPL